MSDLRSSKEEMLEGVRQRHALVERSSDQMATAASMSYLSHLARGDLLEMLEKLWKERDELRETLAQIARGQSASETRDDGWLPISTVPNGHEEFEFWVEPKLPGESFVDTSGTPIVSTGLGFRHIGKYRTWGSLSKATHWRRCPSPPKTGAEP
jgi:hypothetical protein